MIFPDEATEAIARLTRLEAEVRRHAERLRIITASGNVNISGTVTAQSFVGAVAGSITGNAGTATALQTARTINGVSFDGTASITVPAAAGTLTGTTLASGVTA